MDHFWIEVARPLVACLVIPPVPFFGTLLIGLSLLRRHPKAARFAVVISVALLWLTSTVGFARFLAPALLGDVTAITQERINALRLAAVPRRTAIVAIGSGIFQDAPEYGDQANLTDGSLQRLRYAIWLSRQTDIPVAFSGGVGWAGRQGTSEAATASLIAETEFNFHLRWVEGRSRDTLQNATLSIEALRRDGIRHVVLVTSAFQARRAMRAFMAAAQPAGISVESAPMAIPIRLDDPIFDWIPTPYSAGLAPTIFREWIVFHLGA